MKSVIKLKDEWTNKRGAMVITRAVWTYISQGYHEKPSLHQITRV